MYFKSNPPPPKKKKKGFLITWIYVYVDSIALPPTIFTKFLITGNLFYHYRSNNLWFYSDALA